MKLAGVLRIALPVCVAISLAGCVTDPQAIQSAARRPLDPLLVKDYAAIEDHGYAVPAVDISLIDPAMLRQEVDYATPQPVGTIVVDTGARHLYLVEEHGRAMRYGIGVGKEGLAFTGNAIIGRKAEWPYWTPTQAMIAREPERYGPYAKGLPGGLSNPLGARAMYLYKNGVDTAFRIHGTTEPETIGHAVSSGCIRLIDQDVMDLFSRVPSGSRVVVLSSQQDSES